MLKHGGNLREASQQYGIPLANWIDLSTGINPQPYLIPEVSHEAWQRLPEVNDGLIEIACSYYGCQSALPTAGSQAALQMLPQLRSHCRVAMPLNMYQEHAHAWQQHDHQVMLLNETPSDEQVKQLDVLLLCNPNNPTGSRYSKSQLLAWHQLLAPQQGWLIVDEAFMDMTPEESIADHSHLSGLIVLRSLGKFFGLAGARVGFLLAQPKLLVEAQNTLGPWTLTGPSRVIAKTALEDTAWQMQMRQQLNTHSLRLATLLSEYKLTPLNGTSLFQYVANAQANRIHQALAKQGVWVRLFEQPQALRFGLPPEDRWPILSQALKHCTND